MKILFLPKYNIDGASSRYRTYQYLHLFRKNNIKCIVSSFFLLGHVKNHRKCPLFNYLLFPFCALRRTIILPYCFFVDLIIIEKEITPYFPPMFEFLLRIFKRKFLLDYDDAVYYCYKDNPNIFIKKLLSKKIDTIMSLASGVITGSPSLTMFASQFNAKVLEIPTSIDIDNYILYNSMESNIFIIGWIGSFATSQYIDTIEEALLSFLQQTENTYLHLIGYKGNLAKKNSRIKIIPWSSDTEITELQKMNVGIMPLDDTPFAHGKCGFKLIQYMASQKPTISTPFEANIKIDSGNGNLFASTQNDWLVALLECYKNYEKYKQIGIENWRKVYDFYTIQSNWKKYIDFYGNL
ncbi:glycosyl transferase [Bacteroidia bacterium]|nr:glycosyl transferase [Bacteroidia bacterium]